MCDDISKEDAERLSKLWRNCQKNHCFPDPISKESSGLVDLYHATTKENRASILSSGKFLVPSRKYAIENGLKLGAAVYFGSNPDYCISEARNTESNEGKDIVLIRVEMDLGRCINLGNYDDGNNLSWKDWEWMTERLTKVEGTKFGFDSLCMNKNSKSFEIAVYEPYNHIKNISSLGVIVL